MGVTMDFDHTGQDSRPGAADRALRAYIFTYRIPRVNALTIANRVT
jgi:hypothetical protein